MAEVAGLYYELHGPPDAPPLILSSGLGGSASYWTPNLLALARHFRVLVYDHRGTGRSDRALPEVVTVDDLADDMGMLIDAQGWTRASVIGHAAGGVAGLALARKADERLDKLVVINGWAKADPHFLRCFEARLNLLRHAGIQPFLRAQPIFLYPAEWISAHSDELDAELLHQVAAFPGVDSMEKRVAALAAFDATGWIGDLRAPMLALSAGDDMLVPWTCSGRLNGLNPRIHHMNMPWGGHACNVTDAATFDRIVIDFLRS
ncbi:pyrimidine utilization protein D [Sphingobium sp. CCH11-B1]|uniref:pyrimidine utilization protein D n=1 Tax=Sphingobium sp. CCH11-B1 TaxID=1768781 RepID=UPI000836034A|nr:pyrimidine utilization protein D [Sphingobium sp. CCH11-B1]MEA3390930.1 pyrimidine utilization protein D [Pseudomonadota bacterium]